MPQIKLSQLISPLNAKLIGEDSSFELVTSDSRKIQPKQLFIALTGPNFDGHDYVNAAANQGAVAAIVSKPVKTNMPLLIVDNTFVAFGQLAKYCRQLAKIPVIAVTGSCGKTTTKNMIAAILQQCDPTLVTSANDNNTIGVAQTLCRLNDKHQFAVIEIGANEKHEIAYSSNIALPTIAVITNAAHVHIEGFGDIQGVAKVKGDIFNGLSADGTAIINADDDFADYWKSLIKPSQTITTFAINNSADIMAKNVKINQDGRAHFELHTPQGNCQIHLGLLGEHNVMNALAATAAALHAHIKLETIKSALESLHPVDKRLVNMRGKNGARILDDSYNANPHSLISAIKVLNHFPGKKILILGQMGELGLEEKKYHAKLGKQARELGIDQIYSVGELTKETIRSFGEGGFYFDDKQQLITAVNEILNDSTNILIKGSNSNRLWEITEALVENNCHSERARNL